MLLGRPWGKPSGWKALGYKYGTSRQRSEAFLGTVPGMGIRVPFQSTDGEPEVEGSRAQVEGLRLGVAQLEEAREEVSSEVRDRRPVDPVGLAGSPNTLTTNAE